MGGEVLYAKRNRSSPDSAIARFRALPVTRVLHAFEQALSGTARWKAQPRSSDRRPVSVTAALTNRRSPSSSVRSSVGSQLPCRPSGTCTETRTRATEADPGLSAKMTISQLLASVRSVVFPHGFEFRYCPRCPIGGSRRTRRAAGGPRRPPRRRRRMLLMTDQMFFDPEKFDARGVQLRTVHRAAERSVDACTDRRGSGVLPGRGAQGEVRPLDVLQHDVAATGEGVVGVRRLSEPERLVRGVVFAVCAILAPTRAR